MNISHEHNQRENVNQESSGSLDQMSLKSSEEKYLLLCQHLKLP
jgi:hypothetical protein